jgi:hypothetical protein
MLDVIRQHTNTESIERRQRVEQMVADARGVAGEVSQFFGRLSAPKGMPHYGHVLQTLLQIPPRKSSNMESINVLPRAWTPRNVPPNFRCVQSNSIVRTRKLIMAKEEETNNDGTIII